MKNPDLKLAKQWAQFLGALEEANAIMPRSGLGEVGGITLWEAILSMRTLNDYAEGQFFNYAQAGIERREEI